ncbi:uncharacterized protein LOC115885705 [Sitophilus oryzae]|uniref:Uncharacterized protein LOC115885705 n=1 Tax=Sitophilus oryzae TaxID=7048 RepID=A0A6J2YCB2_SITOR|nr:uncharacterized protein LOC115885705 [Sitophilus oryzae]
MCSSSEEWTSTSYVGRQGLDLETSSEVSESVDDYIPHRPKSYHYDEDTKKIVYHNKPEKEEVEEEEIEEIEIPVSPGIYLERAEDATHPTPKKTTTSPLLATATPPADGEGLLDFVLKLKNNPNYKFIPDPTTASPDTLSSAASVSIELQSTTPPAFLNILSKVKSDSRYKYIEDPKEPSAKSKTTTIKPEEEEAEDELEEEEQGKINITDDAEEKLKNIQIFDINQFIPTVQPIVTPTPIDYSKYKTIERPRHNISSRYNADEDRNTEEDESIKRPALLEEQSHTEVSEPSNNSESIIISSTEELSKPTETSVQHKRRRITTARVPESNVQEDKPSSTRTSSRRRARPSSESLDNRPTNSQIIETSKSSEIQISTESVTPDNHGKAKRVYRRRPVRIRSTTEKEVDTDQFSEKIAKRSIPEEDDRSRNLENEKLEADSSQYILIAKDILQDIIKKNHDKQDKINSAVKALEQDSITSETNYGSDSQINNASTLSVDDTLNTTVINDNYTHEDNSPISYNIAQDLIKEVDALAVKQGIIKANKRSFKYLENTDNNNTDSKDIEKIDTANQFTTKLYKNISDDKDSIEIGAFNKNYDKDKSIVNQYQTDDQVIDTTAKTFDNTEQRAVQEESKEISSGGRNYQREEETIIADLLKLIREPFGRNKNSGKPNVERNKNKNKTSNDYNLGTKKLLKYTQTLDLPTQYSEQNDSEDNSSWVEIINKNYDKSKKHGGNYKPEEIFDEFRNNDDLGKSTNIENSKIIQDKIKPDVEIFDQNYNKTAKHGGNYKNDIDNVADSLSQKEVLTEPNSEISRLPKLNEKTEDDKILDVEIIDSNYDKTKKHGGNYKEDEENVTTEDDSLLEKDTSDTNYLIYLMPKPTDYNYSLATDYYMPGKKVLKIVKKTKMLERSDQKNKPVVDNFEEKEALVPLDNKHSVALDPSFITSETKIGEKRVRKYENSYTPDRAYVDNLNIDKFNSPIDSYQNKIDLKVVPKLTDVVLKPEYFYTDPGLPIQINKLHDHTTKIKLDTEDLERAIAEGDLFKSEDLPIREIVDTRRNDDESNIVVTETNKKPIHIERTGKHETLKKPFFIKDPSKRLYFYATV